jgi:hypothetical protein
MTYHPTLGPDEEEEDEEEPFRDDFVWEDDQPVWPD